MDFAINYTIQKHNSGKLAYLQESLDLYRAALDKEVIYVNGELTPWTFKNIVTAGLRLKEFEWTANFINEYSVKINKIYRQNAINYNIATLNFYKKILKRLSLNYKLFNMMKHTMA